tara:strand:+ start:290 stop:754 length:465 start_codon:yes stop_codon:yes gene_type:complete
MTPDNLENKRPRRDGELGENASVRWAFQGGKPFAESVAHLTSMPRVSSQRVDRSASNPAEIATQVFNAIVSVHVLVHCWTVSARLGRLSLRAPDPHLSTRSGGTDGEMRSNGTMILQDLWKTRRMMNCNLKEIVVAQQSTEPLPTLHLPLTAVN